MLKILFYLPDLNGGGAQRIALNLIKKLDRGHYSIALLLVNKQGELFYQLPDNVEIIDLGAGKTLLSIWELRKIIVSHKPDIVFSTLIRTHIALDIALMGIKKRPFVIMRSPNSTKLLLSNGQLGLIMKIMLDRAYRHADRIIAQTPEMKHEIMQFHGIKDQKIIVFINPVDTELIDEKIRDGSNPFDPNDINVVAAGRITKQKGFDILIEAFQKVVSTNRSFKLWIIGEDVVNERRILEALIDRLGLTDHVFFLGFQQNPYLFFYYCDLYVLSSRWEGLPNTVLENLYLKKRVVATKCIPYMEQLIRNEENGLLVEVEDREGLAQAILTYDLIDLRSVFCYAMTGTTIDELFDC